MEKLIVRNFGPIKEAEIDLTKYVVFIGDTSTGKSVLGKLISIFRQASDDIQSYNFKRELKDFNIDFNFKDSLIKYVCSYYQIELVNDHISFIRNYNPFSNFKDVNSIFSNLKLQPISIYFPAERILNSIIGNSISGLWANNVALPIYFKNFAANYEVARKEINSVNYEKFGFNYVYENGSDKIIFKNIKIDLSESSSGIQSLTPLLILFEYCLLSSENEAIKSFLIEEPELSLFPIKQKKLLEHIISKLCNTNHKLIITSHSPYVLTVLDTFILAKNTFNENPDLKEEINAIIPEGNWIDYNEISVYEVRNDGKVYSIKNEEFKSIDTNAIDGVSDIISEEFDKLTELRYAH